MSKQMEAMSQQLMEEKTERKRLADLLSAQTESEKTKTHVSNSVVQVQPTTQQNVKLSPLLQDTSRAKPVALSDNRNV